MTKLYFALIALACSATMASATPSNWKAYLTVAALQKAESFHLTCTYADPPQEFTAAIRLYIEQGKIQKVEYLLDYPNWRNNVLDFTPKDVATMALNWGPGGIAIAGTRDAGYFHDDVDLTVVDSPMGLAGTMNYDDHDGMQFSGPATCIASNRLGLGP